MALCYFLPRKDNSNVDLDTDNLLNVDTQLLKKSKEILEVNVTTLPIFSNNEQIGKYVVIKDISAIKRRRKQRDLYLEEKRKNLELSIQVEKLSVTGQLAAGIAHEIRNPVTAIKGFLQLINDGHVTINKYYPVINSEINRIETIINELLILAKPYNKSYQKEDICTILQQVIHLMESQALLNNIEIECRLTEEKTKVICDSNQMKQVFINIIKNAIEAMPNGGKLYIETNIIGDSFVQIGVIDNGFGIPEDLLNRIGEPFFSTKENGTGLGIVVSKQIIEEHKGCFEINTSSQGTCIEVTLPCYTNSLLLK